MANIKKNLFHETVDQSLQLWDTIPFDTSLKDSWELEFSPVHGSEIGFAPNIEFDIPPSMFYMHLPSTTLYVKGRLLKPDRTKIVKSSTQTAKGEVSMEAAPVNNILHSMFQHCSVELNHTQVLASNLYNYSAYMVHALGYSEGSKKTWLRSVGMFHDRYGDSEPTVPVISTTNNEGLKERYAMSQSSSSFELEGRLCEAIFHVDKLLPSLLKLKLNLQRTDDRLFLLNAETADSAVKLYIDECKLRVTYVELAESMTRNIEHKLQQHPITYVIPNQIVCKDFNINVGVTSAELPRLFQHRVPSRLVVALTTNTAKNGSYSKDPYYFTSRDLRRISLRHNERYLPLKPITVDFKHKGYLNAYNMLNNTVGRGLEDWTPGITFDMFKNGYCFFCWSLVPLGSSDELSLPRQGELSLTLEFNNALTETLSVLCWGEFARTFTVDVDRLVEVGEI